MKAWLQKMNANQEQIIAKMDAHQDRMDSRLEKLEACLEKAEDTNFEANPEEIESEAEHEEVRTEEAVYGPAFSRKAPRSVGEADPGQWCVPEEVGSRPQKDDLPCHSCTA
jgi:hypothetical protein